MSKHDIEVAEIELTEKQAEIADWLMGCPVIDEWHSPDEVLPTFEREHLPQPELEDRKFRFPVDEDLIWYLADPSLGDLTRYSEMAHEAAEVSKPEARGITRASRNLAEKIRNEAE